MIWMLITISCILIISYKVKPGGALIGLSLGNWSGGVISPNLPLCSSPLHMYPSVEGSASPLLAPSVSTSKSGSPVPTGEKLTSAPSPMGLDLPRNHDHTETLPIPEGEGSTTNLLRNNANKCYSTHLLNTNVALFVFTFLNNESLVEFCLRLLMEMVLADWQTCCWAGGRWQTWRSWKH